MQEGNGLQFMRARYYEAGVGRFLARDSYPALRTKTQSINRYLYATPNPVNYTDPTGFFSLKLFGTGLAQLAAAVGTPLAESIETAKSIVASDYIGAATGFVSTYDSINEASKQGLAAVSNLVNSVTGNDNDYMNKVTLAEDFEGQGILDDTLYNKHPNLKAAVKAVVIADTILSVKEIHSSINGTSPNGVSIIDSVKLAGDVYLCAGFKKCPLDEPKYIQASAEEPSLRLVNPASQGMKREK